jgi:hypothetical protein
LTLVPSLVQRSAFSWQSKDCRARPALQNKKQINKIEARQASIYFTAIGWKDYTFWQQADAKVLASINTLINEISGHPSRESANLNP